MKRTLERTTFMLIGALIATIAYLVGNADRGAEARSDRRFYGITEMDELHCKKLIVSDPDFGQASPTLKVEGPILTWNGELAQLGTVLFAPGILTLTGKDENKDDGIILRVDNGNNTSSLSVIRHNIGGVLLLSTNNGSSIIVNSMDKKEKLQGGILMGVSQDFSSITVEDKKIISEPRLSD